MSHIEITPTTNDAKLRGAHSSTGDVPGIVLERTRGI